ncbi:Dolichyl-phosphate-mannose-protein mannosyltransferase [Geodermatophilus pulveris]|uniref:Dolichyl-phosphate-mannose-protein mannosyltransferase n=1 Tax=Geodermatophilus pulveris TaxID=1564159 RepID=A0A239CAR3_9ACTN|nr:glycosyltransferase family 39 protein [Geodermatophilus pulveris]SNS16992.1 Dolichyl-phosphate-mannose-protein mannosyltransferase [Geodermatophilus pulveris]
MTTARWRAALAVLALLAGAAAVLTNAALFPLYSLNRDDSVYVAMAELLQTGAVTLPADADAFRPWASAVVGDRVVLKYTPPWPAVIAAADLLTGSPRAALAVSAAAAAVLVALLAAEVLRDRVAAVTAGALFALSPVVVVQSGTYLPYLPALALGLAAALLLLSGARLGSTPRLVAAGVVAGVAAFARPFDALLTVAPFGIAVLLARERGGLSRPGVVVRVAAGALPVLALTLVYNALVVGGPLRLPFTVTGPQDTFGFGDRGVFPQHTSPFTPADAASGLLANLRGTPGWVAGGLVLVALAALGLGRTAGAARWAVAALAVVVPLGYLPFWGPWAMGTQWEGLVLFGPFYWLPVVVPLAVFGAAGLVRLARRRGPAAVLVAAAMVALTALAVPGPVAGHREVTAEYRAVQRVVQDAGLDDALLFLPRRGDLGFLSDSPFLQNDPALRQPVLYAAERGAADLALAARFPGRSLHRLAEDGEAPPVVQPLRVDAGAQVSLRLRLTVPAGASSAVAYLRAGDRTYRQPLDGSGEVTWTVAAPGSAAGPGAVVPAADGVLAVGLTVRSPGDDGPGDSWERRVVHRSVDGGTRVELLRPGQAWARVDGGGWAPDAVGSPVEELP